MMSDATPELEAAVRESVQKAENLQVRLNYCRELAELCRRQQGIYDDLCKIRDERSVPIAEYNDEAAFALLKGVRHLTKTQVNILMEHAQSWGMDNTMLGTVKRQLGMVMAIRFYRAYAGCGLLEAKQAVDAL